MFDSIRYSFCVLHPIQYKYVQILVNIPEENFRCSVTQNIYLTIIIYKQIKQIKPITNQPITYLQLCKGCWYINFCKYNRQCHICWVYYYWCNRRNISISSWKDKFIYVIQIRAMVRKWRIFGLICRWQPKSKIDRWRGDR